MVAHELRGFMPSGGMGTATTFLALALARLGHDVEILVGVNRLEDLDPYWGEEYVRAGVRLRSAPPPDDHIEPWHFRHTHAIALGLLENEPDVVVAPDFGAAAYAALQLRAAGLAFRDTRFVTFCHGPRRYVMDVNGVLAPNDLQTLLATGVQEEACAALSDAVVSPSTYLLEWMRHAGWTLPADTRVVPYFTRSSAIGEPAPCTSERNAGDKLARVVFFGRVDERKGLKSFAAGLNALEPELLTNVAVEFVGRTSETWTPERVRGLLSEQTTHAVGSISFASDLDQPQALAHLSRPGTVVVMPSLEENSPNAVYECLEAAIPFVASNVGGVPELIAPEDHSRVLFEPTAKGVADALRPFLAARTVPPPARAAFDPRAPSDAWDEIVTAPRTRPAARNASPAQGDFVLVADDGVTSDDEAVALFAHTQSVTDADAVTSAVRVRDTTHLFLGEPRGLGAASNAYGTLAFVRRRLVQSDECAWPLLARLASEGRRIVSVPRPLGTQANEPATATTDSAAALGAAQELERALPNAMRGLVRLAAGLAANAGESGPPKGRGSGRRLLFAVATLTLLGAALRFATLDRQSYWYDELATVAVLRHSFGGMLHAVASREATPYLYYVVAWPWTRLFGLHETALRSLSAVAGTLTIPATYAAGHAFVSRRAGVVAAGLVAFNPFLVWYSQEARAYALLVLFAALSLVFLARRDLFSWAAAAAAVVATHYFGVFIVAAEAVVLLARPRRRALLAVAVPAAVAIAEIPLLAKQHQNGGNLSDTSLVHRIAGTPKDLLVGYSFPAEAAGTAIAVVLVLVGVVLAARRRARVPLAIAIAALVVPIVLALGGADYVIARNLIAVSIPAAIFLAAGYASRRIGLAAATALCALSLAIVAAVAADRQYGRTDWRGAAHALGPASRPRAIVTTPTIDSTLWRPYVAGLEQPQTSRVGEIDVVALATQGGFSAGAVKPPPADPRPAPPGFQIAGTRSTSTYSVVRYLSPTPRTVTAQGLARLALANTPAAVFYQDSRR